MKPTSNKKNNSTAKKNSSVDTSSINGDTSKIEIESVSDELTTTNHELPTRNSILNEADEYTEAIVDTLHDPFIILDKNLYVKSANKPFYKKFNVNEEETEGRLFFDLGNKQWDIPALRELLLSIIPKNSHFYDYEITHTFESIGEKIMLVNAKRIIQKTQREQLILISISDITEVRNLALQKFLKEKEVLELQIKTQQKIEEAYKNANANLKNIFLQAPAAIAIFEGPEQQFTLANSAYEKIINRKAEDLIGKSLREVLPELKGTGTFELYDNILKTGEPFIVSEYAALADAKNDGVLRQMYLNLSMEPLKNDEGKVYGVLTMTIDITEQVEDRKKIEESEAFNRSVLESSPDCVKIVDAEGRLQFMNVNGLCTMEIDDFSVIKNKPWKELWGEENKYLINGAIDKALAGNTASFQAFCPTAKGTPKWWDVLVSPVVSSESNKINSLISVSRDVTEQMLAQKKIEESENKQAFLLKLSDALMSLSGSQQIKIKAMQVLGEHLNVSRCYYAEILKDGEHCLIDNSFSSSIDTIDGTYRLEDFGKAKVAVLQRGEVILTADVANDTSVTQEERNRNLEMQIHAYINVPLVKDNKLICLLGVNQSAVRNWTAIDITIVKETAERTWAAVEKAKTEKQLEESEAQFNTLANNIQNLAWMADGEGYIYWYNERWYDYTGTTLEEMKGQGWEKVHHPDHVNRVVDFVKKAWQKNESWELTFPLRGANGEYRWFLTRAYPITDEEGKIINWIGTNTDITEQKTFAEQLEEQVKGRTAELVKMNKELQSFAYISSHDLQEPLRKIQTFATRITEKEANNLSDNGKDMFNRMQESARRMQTLIQDLLAYSRTNTEERKPEKTDLNRIVEEVREDLKEELKDKHATIEATALCEAHIIPFQFRQLLHNLIGNSLKFSIPNNPPHIKIESEIAKGIKFNNDKLLPENKYCHITVSDNGIGFEQQYSEKIFELFQRLHGKNEYNGTGIGLSIVKKIVENHNGIITANGELNKGATFEIYIPAT
jgi:PAS domain S-box-containing protein